MAPVEAPTDLDTARAGIAAAGLVRAASDHLTTTVATALPFPALGPFKDLLKRFFSTGPWTDADAAELSDLVTPHLSAGWWHHDLGRGYALLHGLRSGRYVLWATGDGPAPAPGVFDRVFTGPVLPEPTPHPRKVRFAVGGAPAPGVWYQRGDPGIVDPGVTGLLELPEVTDVLVAGDFVTVGIRRGASWDDLLDPILDRVTASFAAGGPRTAPALTRDELVARGRSDDAAALHLLDPDAPEARDRLLAALESDEPRLRRVAVAVLAESADPEVARAALRDGASDPSRLVRRTAVDVAGDAGDPALRHVLEAALGDADAWIRWRAVRALRALGVGPSRDRLAPLAGDPDFQVRFEVAAALRPAPDQGEDTP